MKRIQLQSIRNRKGVSLIELLIAMAIAAITVAGIFRLFIAQGRAYTVQEQVTEVQQSIRTAMELLSRDLRMTGFDDDSLISNVAVPTPIAIGDDTVTVAYEYVYDQPPRDGCGGTPYSARYIVNYRRDAGTSRLLRQLHIDCQSAPNPPDVTDVLLDNVEVLGLTYGVDENLDGGMDDRNGNGVIDAPDWLSTAAAGSRKVVAVRVFLQARPTQVNPDLQGVTPRSLVSAVTLRNLSITQ